MDRVRSRYCVRQGWDLASKIISLIERFERKVATNGQFYFTLTAVNKQVIGKSETYKSTASREKGIASVKRNAPEAPIVEVASA